MIGRAVYYQGRRCQVVHAYSDGARCILLLDCADYYNASLVEAPATQCQLVAEYTEAPASPSWPDIPGFKVPS